MKAEYEVPVVAVILAVSAEKVDSFRHGHLAIPGSMQRDMSEQQPSTSRDGGSHADRVHARIATTGLLPQEPSELCVTFSRDLPR